MCFTDITTVVSSSYCISFTEMISPGLEEIIGDADRIREFYSTFINTIGQIVIQHKGKILPTVDGLMSYFPQTKDLAKIAAIKDVLECCLQQLEKRQSLSIELSNKELPKISYRVTADFGEVLLDTQMSKSTEFAFTVPLICKIGGKMPTNAVVLGGDLYEKINTLPRLNEEYTFEVIGQYIDTRKEAPYSLYSLFRKQKSDLN
jgi:two-component system, OmpR family, response regulator ChvI